MTAVFGWRIGLAALVWLALVLPGHAEKRVALVIGNSKYVNVRMLANPSNDANAVAALLKQANFDVVEASNDLGAMAMRRVFRDFSEKVQGSDVAVVYYAGHGIEVDGTNYLLPVDTVLKRNIDIEDEAISLDRVVRTLASARQLRLVILDACRDNPFGKGRGGGRGLARVEPTSSDTLIAFAAKAGSTAADGDDKHSPFTTALLRNLTTPGLDLRMAFGRVRDEVMAATANGQEPFVYGSLGGSVVSLVPEPKKVVAVTPPSSPPQQPAPNSNADVRRDYEAAERIGTKEAWDYFLADYPAGLYANLARAARGKLDTDQAGRQRLERERVEQAARDKTQRDDAERKRLSDAKAASDKAQRDEGERKRIAADKAATDKLPEMKLAALPPESPRNLIDPKFVCGPPMAQGAARIATGGPFNPVSIKINLDGARDIHAVAISPHGDEIATAGDDGLIRIWNASSYKLVRTLKGHDGPVYSVDYARDGSLLASAGWDGTVKLWNPANDRPLHTFEATSPEGKSGPIKQFSVAFYPVTPLKYLASGGEDGTVRIWDLTRKDLARARVDHQSNDPGALAVRSLSYAPNGSGEFVTAGFDGKLRFYRTEGGRVDVKDAYGRKAIQVAYSPDGLRILSTGSETGRPNASLGYLKLWNVKAQSAQPLIGPADYVVSASWSPDGKLIASGGGGLDKTVRLWDGQSGKPLAALTGHTADIEAVVFDAKRSRLISVSEDKTMKVWDLAAKKEIVTVAGFGDRDYVVTTPEGCYAGSGGIEARLGVFDGKTARPLTDGFKAQLLMR